MHLTPTVERAIRTAVRLHRGQVRKGRGRKVPYISHLLSVAELVATETADEEIIVAAIMHDSVEDCDYTFERLEADFGRRVAQIVRETSEDMALKDLPDEKATWEERKVMYIDHLARADRAALLVCCADKLHNLESTALGYQELGFDAIWSRFNAPADRQLWYYTQIADVLKRRLDSPLVGRLLGSLESNARIFRR
ncbi:hypothetical protein AMJ57_01570 [Parcubacteria bacterium SG8_24]|nr:MAG: hypothetical protein AMJ57_01570 [Parcubacteria bacterium SG8_24]